ncbi:MAG: hypothetical protein ACRD2B_17305 [Terriglobia bacterium]
MDSPDPLRQQQLRHLRRGLRVILRLAFAPGERRRHINWAELAADGGFADQPHLAHEVRVLTGRSPAQFEIDVREIKHGDLLE